MTGPWERDLSLDLDTIRGWGAAAVVTLVKQHELRLLKVESLGEGVRNRGMLWFHLPILDVSIPDEAFERQWETDGATILKLLRDGQDVVVHCRGGIGRAGTIAGRLLVELGMDATSAIKQVRAVRAGAIETRAQELYVHSIGLSKQRSGVVTPD
jgi:ADP-ribosyl-[dinitrogen reductase] hydrolase